MVESKFTLDDLFNSYKDIDLDNIKLTETFVSSSKIPNVEEVNSISKDILDIINKEFYKDVKVNLPSIKVDRQNNIRLDYSLGRYNIIYDKDKNSIIEYNDNELAKEYEFEDKLNDILLKIKNQVKSSIYKISSRIIKDVGTSSIGWYNTYSIYVTLKSVNQ